MMRIVLLSFLMVSLFSQDVSKPQTIQEPQSYQRLTIHDDHYHLEISYPDSRSNIPKSLKNILNRMSINSLALQMGFINPSALQKDHSMYSSSLNFPHVNHEISLLINNSTQISHQNFQSIAQIFSISRESEFLVYLSEVQTTFASNSNDKFCAQHLKRIVDSFMPCKNTAGIGAIINDKTFFVGKAFAGVKLAWTIGGRISLAFYLDENTQQVKNYLKLSEQKRYFKRCMHLDQFSILDQDQTLNQDSIPGKKQVKLPSIIYTSSISSEFHSNYYSPIKSLFYRIKLSQLRHNIFQQNSRINQSQIKMIKGRILFPKGFQIDKVSYDCLNPCSQLVQKIEVEVFDHENGSMNENMFVKFQVRLLPNESSHKSFESDSNQSRKYSQEQNSQLLLKIKYKSNLKPFEDYQTIAGGGQEFTNIPLTVEMEDNHTFIVLGHKNRNMFDRLLQPDFSIPFKTITFTIAIFGYLWIAIWKAYYSQVQHIKQNIQSAF